MKLEQRSLIGVLVALVAGLFALGTSEEARAQSACLPRFQMGPQFPYPSIANRGTNNDINALITYDPDGSGPKSPLLVAGGSFTTAGGTAINRVAAWDGSNWLTIGPQGFNGTVNALVLHNGELYAAGNFTASGPTAINRVARYNAATFSWVPVGLGLNAEVLTLESHNGELFAGGHFTANGNGTVSILRLARFNGASWVSMGGANAYVAALKTWGGRLYIGGAFTQVNAVAHSGICFWTSAGGFVAMGSGINPSNNKVLAFATQGTDLLVGGDFAWIGSAAIPAHNIARFTPNATSGTFSSIPAFPLTMIEVEAIISTPTGIYAGGTDGHFVAMRHDGTQWSNHAYSNLDGAGHSINAFAMYDGEVHAGGRFGWLNGGLTMNNAARLHDGNWQPLAPRLNGTVGTFTNFQGSLIVGGDFGQTLPDFSGVSSVLAYNATSGQFGGYGHVVESVGAFFVSSNGVTGFPTLYTGGLITNAGTSAPNCNNIAGWQGPIGTGGVEGQWSTVANGFTNSAVGFNAPVFALTGYGFTGFGINRTPILHAGGFFTHGNGVLVNNVAKYASGTWQPLGSGVTSTNAFKWVNCFATFNGNLIVGGVFDFAGGLTANSIASWNGTTWSTLSTGVRTSSSKGTVADMSVYNGLLYAGGTFITAGGTPVNNIATWNGSTWANASNGMLDPGNEEVQAFAQLNGDLYCATHSFVASAGRVYKLIGGVWTPALGVTDDFVYALFPYNNRIQVGGAFLHAGATDSRYWAQIACVCPADFDDGTGTGTPDGAVDISDLLAFLAFFDAGNLVADIDDGTQTFTPDQAVDISDLLYFLARFEIGC